MGFFKTHHRHTLLAKCFLGRIFLKSVLVLAVATARVNKVALLRRRADAATVARERRTAAVGAHDVIRERQQMLIVEHKRRTVRANVCPLRRNEALRRRILEIRSHIHTIVRADRRRAEATIHEVIHKALPRALGPVRHTHQHRDVRQKQENQHSNQIHSTVRHLSTLDAEFCQATRQHPRVP